MGRKSRKKSEVTVAESSSSESLTDDSDPESIEEKEDVKEKFPTLEDFLNRRPKIYQPVDKNDAGARVSQTSELLYDALEVSLL